MHMKSVMAITALLPIVSFGGIYNEALIWFRGGHDANGDGILQSNEFYDSAHAKSETAYQTCTISGTVKYEKGAVWSRHNTLATNEQYYLSFKNGAAADAASCASLKAVNPLVGTKDTYEEYTIHMRFRWDGTYAPGSDGKITLVNNGQNWGGQRGYFVRLDRQGDSGNTFKPYYYFGANGNGTGYGDTTITLTPGEWNDWFLLVKNVAAGANASLRFVLSSLPGRVADPWGGWSKSPWISTWTSGGASKTATIAMSSASDFLVADKTFSGDIAQWAFWPKRLNDREIRDVLSMPCPGDCVFRVGYENGSAKELAAAGAPAAVISAQDTWDNVPPELSESVRTLTIGFDVGARHAGLDQVLRVKAASGEGWLKAEIRKTSDAAWQRLGVRGVSAETAAVFGVPAAALGSGAHQVRLTYDGGSSPILLDVIDLRGGWLMGTILYNTFYNTGVNYFDTSGVNWSDGYSLLWGYWYGVATYYPLDESPLTSNMLTLKFDVPAEMTGCAHCLYFSLNQWAGGPTEMKFYVNGELFLNRTGTWQYEVFRVNFPANTFKAGENVLQVRHTGGPSNWWGSMRGMRMQVDAATVPKFFRRGAFLLVK